MKIARSFRHRLVTTLCVVVSAATLTSCSRDDGRASNLDTVRAGCHVFTGWAEVRGRRLTGALAAMDSARSALSSGVSQAKLQRLKAAESAALKAQHQYARTPDTSLVGIGMAASSDHEYDPVLNAFLSGDIDKAKAACARY